MKTFNRKLFTSAVISAALMTLPLTSFAFGEALDLKLHPDQIAAFSISYTVPVTGGLQGQSTCPSFPTASNPLQFYVLNNFNFVGTNDIIHFYNSSGTEILNISHARIDNHVFKLTKQLKKGGVVVPGIDLYTRQDWTRIKDNLNGIDDKTGLRHYIGNFAEESQLVGGSPVITAESKGVMTLLEPLVFAKSENNGYATLGVTKVNAVNYIGPQAGWLEPFSVQDARTCSYLNTGTAQPVAQIYNFTCNVGDNIVGCPAVAVPPEAKL